MWLMVSQLGRSLGDDIASCGLPVRIEPTLDLERLPHTLKFWCAATAIHSLSGDQFFQSDVCTAEIRDAPSTLSAGVDVERAMIFGFVCLNKATMS